MKNDFLVILFIMVYFFRCPAQTGFHLNSEGYFENRGVNVMAFQDFYPEGHQGGVVVVMHGMRLASNGDLRLDETPGQWQPIPKLNSRRVDTTNQAITARLSYPDPAINRKGFNPIVYPDLELDYTVTTRSEGNSIVISVDLAQPIPAEFYGKVGFNLELFPGWLFGKTWSMDGKSGIFPRQANGPAMTDNKGKAALPCPMATGRKLVVAPEDDRLRLSIVSHTGDLQLLDGRYQHNNGWFVVRSEVAPGASAGAIEWKLTPHVIPDWTREPVVIVSQVGYHPAQPKKAFIEADKNDLSREQVRLVRVGEDGERRTVSAGIPQEWGKFLRYRYFEYDFTEVKEPGVYILEYGHQESHPFRIDPEIYCRDVWQPVLEYFLPVQMCHMRIGEKYRVWHDLCHMDDARMAPVSHNHFDGYIQGESTLTSFNPGDHIPGLNTGGWHDAGDYDLRVESQSGEVYVLAQISEAFGVKTDETFIDQHTRMVEIHQPDGKPDILQQIEHGVLSVVGGYKNLGRLYRGIICPTLEQYVLLGDGSAMTDGLIFSDKLNPEEKTATHSSLTDDRWVFTEENPERELTTAAHLAAASRVLKGFNDTLASRCLEISEELYRITTDRGGGAKIHAATELFLTTGKKEYLDHITGNEEIITKEIGRLGWIVAKAVSKIDNKEFISALRKVLAVHAAEVEKLGKETPFGVPYRPRIWGAGWDIQSFGVRQYYLHKAFPDLFPADQIFSALNFILGVHPGTNTASFASGIGVRSATVAYGVNRADWSYIPGGVVSGTALIRPDFPELLDWPYLWQQQEYVMGGGSTHFMFLVLAAHQLLQGKQETRPKNYK